MVYVFEQILCLRDAFFFANQKQFFKIGLPWKSFKKNLAPPTSSQELAVGISVGEAVGLEVGELVGLAVGLEVGAFVG